MAKNYETDRNESNYAGKKSRGKCFQKLREKTALRTVREILPETVPKAATETKFPMNMILRRTEALTDIKG